MAHFCAAATGPSGRSAWSIIPPPLTRLCAVECINLALLIDTEQGWSPFRFVIGQAMCTRHPYHTLAIYPALVLSLI